MNAPSGLAHPVFRLSAVRAAALLVACLEQLDAYDWSH